MDEKIVDEIDQSDAYLGGGHSSSYDCGYGHDHGCGNKWPPTAVFICMLHVFVKTEKQIYYPNVCSSEGFKFVSL